MNSVKPFQISKNKPYTAVTLSGIAISQTFVLVLFVYIANILVVDYSIKTCIERHRKRLFTERISTAMNLPAAFVNVDANE